MEICTSCGYEKNGDALFRGIFLEHAEDFCWAHDH